MNATLEFLMKQHEHVFESIKLADQKAAAITAISVGTIYLLYELMKAPCFAQWPWRCIGGVAQVFLLLSTGLALWSIHPPVGLADRDVVGGTHTIPARAVKLSQADYVQWAVTATADDRANEVASLVYARMKIREWKYDRVQWAICTMYVAYSLLLLLVGHFMVHTVRTRRAPSHGHKANQSGGTAVPPGEQTPLAHPVSATAEPATPDSRKGTPKILKPNEQLQQTGPA